ncbi:MAG: hypothetical protein OXG24_09480 [Gammaproteobacteria bacterium]|nr:hypothetical protein [Gammaproteobacteria bacterium]
MKRTVFRRSIACSSAWASLFFLTLNLSSQEIELIDCEGEWADSPLCKEREEAFENKARVDSVLEDLPELEDPPWNKEQHEKALADYEKAMGHYNEGYFGDASSILETVLESLLSLQNEFEVVATQTEELAFSLLEEDKYSEAIPHLKKLELWLPPESRVTEGIAHASRGMKLDAQATAIEELVANQAFDDVAAELAHFPDGFWEQRINNIREQLSIYRHKQSFNALMSRGLKDLDAGQWEAAQDSFRAALKLSPNSIVAKESFEEASVQLTKTRLATLYESLSIQEEEELWEEMLRTLASIEQLVPNRDVETSRKEVKHLLDTEALLKQAISKASAPMNKQVRTEIQRLIGSTEELNSHSRIQQQLNILKETFDLNTKRVSVTVISDGATNVIVRPGQTLGKFSKKVLSVYPGSYDFIGRRTGYHETRKSITIEPDSKEIEVRVVCDVRF